MNTSSTHASKGHTGGVGPFRFGARVKGMGWLGRVYRAWNAGSGAPALVVVPTGEQPDMVPVETWRLRLTSCPSPAYLALEVESGPATPSADAEDELVDMLDDLRDAAREAVRTPGVLKHLVSPAARRSRGRRVAGGRIGLRFVAAGAVAAAAVVLAVSTTTPAPEPFDDRTLPPMTPAQAVFTDLASGAGNRLPDRYRVPDAPMDGQARAPCRSPSVEVNGGCWLKLDASAPCPKNSAEYRGGCYVPVSATKKDNVTAPGGLY
ncbi:hypothetical protein HJC22_18315 [Corallococcus exiguus]|uniref:hypothetical protein n=1 Tax=Corallococcus exiguus TaxID=83462 RepID=UPI001471AC27|nr:hypothetical protein [Corallococcus exiguus]MBN8466158.1 hypothetical protein [Corallococcus exiguus]NNC17676.1 hypothetical protein [Corallococcus exiguus]